MNVKRARTPIHQRHEEGGDHRPVTSHLAVGTVTAWREG